jgi:type 1 fimbriae regulatory protein FimB
MQKERLKRMPEISNLDGLSDTEKLALIARLQSEVSGSSGVRNQRRRKVVPILYLTEVEINALFRAIEAEGKREDSRTDPIRDRALFEVAMARGLRASEVGLLDLKHLRLKENRLYVTRLKGGRTGEFLITEREARALKPYLKRRGWLPGPLFTSRNRRAISRRRLDELMKIYGSRAALPIEKRHFHCIRHTCATRLLDQGVSIEEVQDILGHEDIRNTMIYAKITNARRMELGARIRESW